MLAAALRYAAKDWAVFPCRPRQKVPATKHGCKDATTDTDQIHRWWTAMPDANIGVATGAPSGIYVLDIDAKDGGHETLMDLIAAHTAAGAFAALWQMTPTGGYHAVFKMPHGDLGNTAKTLGAGLDTRGTGGYILAAPSVHPNGGRYRWGERIDPPTIPGWLLTLLRPAPKPRTPAKPLEIDSVGDEYIDAALQGEAELVAQAQPGARNHTLNTAAFNLGQLVGAGLLSSDRVWDVLTAAGRQCGLGDREIHRTLTSGLTAGTQHPRGTAA